MPQPSMYDVHVDAILTNISVAYIQAQTAFIAPNVFPIIPVDKASDKYYTWPKNDWFRDEATRRGDSEESSGGGMTLSTDNYSCDVWAFHKDVGHLTQANSDIDMGLPATEWVTQRLLLRKEIQWVTDYFTTSVWGTDATPTNLWSDPTLSDPLADFETAKRTILLNTGMAPNTLVMGYDVFIQLKNHPDIVDRYKYTTASVITPQMIGAMLEIPRVFVAQAVKATNVEGETAAYAFTHGKHGLLCHVAESPSIMTPSAGYIFAWKQVSENLGEVVGISNFYMPTKKATRYEGEIAFDDKVVGSDLGYFFSSAVA